MEKYLFGIATSEDLNQISQQMDHLSRGEEGMIYLETHVLSFVSETTTAPTAINRIEERVLREVLMAMKDVGAIE